MKVSALPAPPELARMLFSLQRFHILALYGNTAAEQTVSASYAFAWLQGVYPLLNDSAPWHKPFADCFDVSRERIAELRELLQARASTSARLSFYELEDHYGIRGSRRPGPHWTQASLINATRYFYLHQAFRPEFWERLLGEKQCPLEAEVIARPFGVEEIRFE